MFYKYDFLKDGLLMTNTENVFTYENKIFFRNLYILEYCNFINSNNNIKYLQRVPTPEQIAKAFDVNNIYLNLFGFYIPNSDLIYIERFITCLEIKRTADML